MKKVTLCILVFISTYSALCQNITIIDTGPKDKTMNDHRCVISVVDVDKEEIYIKSDSIINDVNIIIRDQYNNIIHQSTQTIGPDEITIYIPNQLDNCEKTTIDLYYDKKHLYGLFEQ